MAKERNGERREPTFDSFGGPNDKPRRNGPKAKKRKPKEKRGSILSRLVYWMLMLGLWASVGASIVVAYYAAQLPPIDQLAIPKRPPNIAILADNGALLANRGDMGGAAVHLAELPPYLPKAFIAIEDRRFYDHWGIDPIGILRALVRDAIGRGGMEGGSTLTQQLAKNLFLTQERTLSRKIQEAILAVWLEHKYTKDQILELYLNRVYFGAGAFGVEAAAQKYFGHSARDVSLAEAAMLAGLMKAPSRYAPNHNLPAATERAGEVIRAMREQGFITKAMADLALARPARPTPPKAGGTINYVADYVMDQLDDLIGPVDEDIVVKTTIAAPLQAAAEKSLRDALASRGPHYDVSQGALVALDMDGALRALVGGRDYAESQFDRATAAKRQPGSAFKPFVYLTALEHGLTPDSVRNDAPINLRGWQPENYEHRYLGPVTLTTALANSLNTVAVRLGLEVGPGNVARTAHRLGITSSLDANPTIALGTSSVTPLELVSAYVPFANGGIGVTPYVVAQISTAKGRVLYQHETLPEQRVIAAEYLPMMNRMMMETLLTGTARRADLPGWQAAGKTGTSQDFRDAWFIGYTSHMVCGVWLGNDDDSPTKRATGGSLPVVVWSHFMQVAHAGLQPAALTGGIWTGPSQGSNIPVASSILNFLGLQPQPAPAGAMRPPPPIALGQSAARPAPYRPNRQVEDGLPPAPIPNGSEASRQPARPFFGLF